MRQYERYLFLHLLWPTVVVTVSLLAIVWLTQILKFLDFMLSKGLSISDFFYLTGLMLPSLLLMLIPISLCIAVIYTYNKLMVESELIVLSAVGISKWQLAKPVIVMGLASAALCYVLALYLMPVANSKFHDIRTFFRDKYASVLLEEEVFNNPVDGVTVYVQSRDDAGNLSGILMHDGRDPAQMVTMLADRGRMEQTSAGPRFYLHDGVRQQWRNGRVSWLNFDSYAIDIAFYGQNGTRNRKPEEHTLGELFNTQGLSKKQAAAYRVEAHQRITWPLLALSLPLFGLAMLFSSEFNRRGQARRMLAASAGILAIMLAYFICRSLGLKHGLATSGLYIVVLGTGIASGRLLLRGRVLTSRRRVPDAQVGGH